MCQGPHASAFNMSVW